jgi:hypothetical protein
MSYEKKIEIYKQIVNFNAPLASNPSRIANSSIGSLLILIDDDVWVQDWNDSRVEQHAKAVFSQEFVRLNPTIFERVV